MDIDEVQVLIVGGSLVGLTLAALLGLYGVEGCLVVEKYASTAMNPRATVIMRRCRPFILYASCLLHASPVFPLKLSDTLGAVLANQTSSDDAGIQRARPVRDND